MTNMTQNIEVSRLELFVPMTVLDLGLRSRLRPQVDLGHIEQGLSQAQISSRCSRFAFKMASRLELFIILITFTWESFASAMIS